MEAKLAESLDALIQEALAEDLGSDRRDLTTEALISPGESGGAEILVKSPLILAGLEAARRTFLALDERVDFKARASDGARLEPGSIAATIEGALRAILTGERTALNFLQRMSGVATLTARYVEAVSGTRARILDTRKTTPGWRALEKYAVRCGGGTNHRMGLYDAVLIKENHIRAAGGCTKAVERARGALPGAPVEVEVTTLGELDEVLEAGVDRILLDNMDLPDLQKAVSGTAGRVPLEASGGITLENVRAVAECGVDFISVGALTHSAPAADLSLEVVRG